MSDVISLRQLNRTTLDRQMLLEPVDVDVVDAVDRLVGLQAQVPRNPYVALWSRLRGFQPEALEHAMTERSLVRIVVMRGTIHLVTAADACRMRPLMQPVLDGELDRHPDFGRHTRDRDLSGDDHRRRVDGRAAAVRE